MDIRPMQAALASGRAASRWATRSSTSTPLSLWSTASIHRQFSTSRTYLQEAEAAAPVPPRDPLADLVEQSQREASAQTTSTRTEFRTPYQFLQSSPVQSNNDDNNNNNNKKAISSVQAWLQPKASNRERAIAIKNRKNIVPADQKPSINDLAPMFEKYSHVEKPIDVKYRLRPSVGTTINCSDGTDPGSALAMLRVLTNRNQVARDAMRQKFHERKGMKRKRLHSERWVNRFKIGFKATCDRAYNLAAQGW